jgi:E3 ubiquitin-protein ligase UBR4
VNIGGETTPSIFSGRLVCELYSKTLAKCSTVLHQKMSKSMMRLGDLPRLLAQVCLDGLEKGTDRHTVEHVALEAERACSLLGPALTHDEHKLIASLVNVCVKSSEWTEPIERNVLRLDERFVLCGGLKF